MYWLAVSAVGLVVLVAQSGVGQVSISQVSQALARHDKPQARRVISNALGAVGVAGVVTAAASALVLSSGVGLGHRDLSLSTLLFVVIGGGLCPIAMQLVDNLRAQHRLKTAAWLASQPASGGVLPGFVMFVGLVIVSGLPSLRERAQLFVYASFLLGWLLLVSLCTVILSRHEMLLPRASDLSVTAMRTLLAASGPVIGSALAMFVITQADLWFVNFYLGANETAAYGLAATLVKYVSAVNVLLGALIPGVVGQLWAQGERLQLAALLVRLARLGALSAGVVLLAIFLFGQQLLVAVVGPAYETAWMPLVCLAVGYVVNAVLGYSQVVLVTAGQFRVIGIASGAACVANLAALALLTPSWGMTGAAAASATGLAVYNTITCFGCIRATGIVCHAFGRITHSHDR